MDKRILGVIGLVFLVGLVGFVVGSMNIKEEYTTGNSYNVEINVVKGWNLISGFYDVRDIIGGSEIKKENVKAIWYYSPVLRKYLNVHPNIDENEFEDDATFLGGDDPILTSAKWLYSDKSGVLKYSTIRFDKLEKRKLFGGWNFVAITPEMVAELGTEGMLYSMEVMKGTCNIEKLYGWETSGPNPQNWVELNLLKEYFEGFDGYGIVVKVSNDCNLGRLVDSDITPPPNLP